MRALITALTLMLAGGAWAEYYPPPEYRVFGASASEADEIAIDELITRFREAWSEEDAEGVAAAHTADAEWVNAFGRTFRGADALETFLREQLFPAFDPSVSRGEMESYREVSRRYIGDEAAVISALMDSDRGSSVGEGSRRVSFNLVLARQGGGWRIAHQVITDLREIRDTEN